MNERRMPRRTAAVAAASALLGAAAALSLGAAVLRGPPGTVPPAPRAKPTPEEVTAETTRAMAALNQFVGRWDIAGQALDESGKTVSEFTGSSHWMFVLDENFLVGETILNNNGAILDQVDYIGYSPGLHRYTHVMMTELDKSMVYQHGEWSPETSTFAFAMAAPLDTPRGTPRSVGMEYAFGDGGIDVTMTMQSGTKPARTVKMRLTRSAHPAAPTGPGGFPSDGRPQVRVMQGDPARMQQEMGAAMAQLTAQRQAAAQAFNGTNEAWDVQFGQVLRPDGADAAAKARESMQGPD
jgi:hypothetical protein